MITTQFNTGLEQPRFTGNKTSMLGKLGGALAGAAFLTAFVPAAIAGDTVTLSKTPLSSPVEEASSLKASAPTKWEVQKEYGDAMIHFMQEMARFAQDEKLPALAREFELRAESAKKAQEELDKVDFIKEDNIHEKVRATALYAKRISEQYMAFLEFILTIRDFQFASKFTLAAQDPNSGISKADKRVTEAQNMLEAYAP